MEELQNTKTFKLKDALPTGLKKFLQLKKLKIEFHEHMLLMISMVKILLGTFYKKELQKTNQQEFRIQKVIKKKGNKLYVKWKRYNNLFNSWIDKFDFIV